MLDLIAVQRTGKVYSTIPHPPAIGAPYSIGTADKPQYQPDFHNGLNTEANLAYMKHTVKVIMQIKNIPVCLLSSSYFSFR